MFIQFQAQQRVASCAPPVLWDEYFYIRGVEGAALYRTVATVERRHILVRVCTDSHFTGTNIVHSPEQEAFCSYYLHRILVDSLHSLHRGFFLVGLRQ